MPETITALQTALENEAKLFLKLINALEGEELYAFIRLVALLKVDNGPHTSGDEVIHVARNVDNIETALDNFYTI